jgi:16S rRNA (uracil1498-N3)-methyltransferase
VPRFFIPPSAIRGKSFTLSGSEAHHALNVLRKKTGDEIELFDGKDAAFIGKIESISAQEIRGSILEDRPAKPLPVQIALYQGLARGPKWEWLLEKACEVGVARIVPVFTQRSLIKLDAAQASEKVKRWSRIALAASKQCGRTDLMTVDLPIPLSTALSKLDKSALSLIPWEKESGKSIQQACQGYNGHMVNIFIGPEGGWDAAEIEQARRSGAIPVRLGPTLLRTETAGIVAPLLVLREFGVY